MSSARRGAKAAKGLANAADSAATAGKKADRLTESAFKTSFKGNAASIARAMPRSAYFKNIKMPDLPLKSSNLFNARKALKNSVPDLPPKKTSDLLKSVSKSVDDLPLQKVDDLAKSLKKIDIDDVPKLVSTARKSSLGKLKDISTQLGKNLNKRTKLGKDIASGTAKKIDETIDGKAFKKAKNMTDAMKKSKKTWKYVDEAAEVSGKIGKNKGLRKGLDLIDDLAGKAWDALKFAKKHDGKFNMGIFGAFLIQEYMNGNLQQYIDDFSQVSSDPGDADVVSAVDEASAHTEITTIDESSLENNSVLTSDSALLVIAALGLASVVV